MCRMAKIESLNQCFSGFRTSAGAAAGVRICSKDAASFDREITGRVDLISQTQTKASKSLTEKAIK